MRSFAHCSSSVRILPSSVEAKPHCGLRHSWSSATYLIASSILRLMSSLRSSPPLLEVTRPRTTFAALRDAAQRLEGAGAVAVVFEEIAVDVELAEQPLGNRLVAALGDERGAEISAAGMHGDRHAGGPASQRLPGHANVPAARRDRRRACARLFAPSDRRSSTKRCRRAADNGSRHRRRHGWPCGRPAPHHGNSRRDRDRRPC